MEAESGSSRLSQAEQERYAWQMSMPDFGESGQLKLKNSSVLVSRIGGVGGTVALYLAAAGVGRLVLAHRGNIEPGDLNRQVLMTTPALGTSRVLSAKAQLQALNPHVDVESHNENIGPGNAEALVAQADIVVGAAPRFEERLSLNKAAVRQGKPLVDAAMYEWSARLTCVLPGVTACLECLYPEAPPLWRREFPVIGAVSGAVAAMAAVEVIKLLLGFRTPLAGHSLLIDLSGMQFRQVANKRRKQCCACADSPAK